MRLPQTAIDAIQSEIESHQQDIVALENILLSAGVGGPPVLSPISGKGAAPAKKGEKRVMTPEQRAHLSKKIKAAHKKKKKLALKAAEAAAAVATPAGEEEFEVNTLTGATKGLPLAPGTATPG